MVKPTTRPSPPIAWRRCCCPQCSRRRADPPRVRRPIVAVHIHRAVRVVGREPGRGREADVATVAVIDGSQLHPDAWASELETLSPSSLGCDEREHSSSLLSLVVRSTLRSAPDASVPRPANRARVALHPRGAESRAHRVAWIGAKLTPAPFFAGTKLTALTRTPRAAVAADRRSKLRVPCVTQPRHSPGLSSA